MNVVLVRVIDGRKFSSVNSIAVVARAIYEDRGSEVKCRSMSIYASQKRCHSGLLLFHEVKRRCRASGRPTLFITLRVFHMETFFCNFSCVVRFDCSITILPRNCRLKTLFVGIFTTRTSIGMVDHRVAVAANCMCNCVIVYPAPSLNISFRHSCMPPRHAFGKWGYGNSVFKAVYLLLIVVCIDS